MGVDDGGVPTHNRPPRNAISERIAVNQKFISSISTLIYRKVVEGPHLGISSSIAIAMALCLAYIVRTIPEKTLRVSNGIDDTKSGVHDGRGQTAVKLI